MLTRLPPIYMAVACLINTSRLCEAKKKVFFYRVLKQVIMFEICQACTDEIRSMCGRVSKW